MTTDFFGDSEALDAIDVNPAATPDLDQVKRRFDESILRLTGLVRRSKRARIARLTRMSRRYVIVATLSTDGSSIAWLIAALSAAESDPEYRALDVDDREVVKTLVGIIFGWLSSEGSLG